MTNQDSTRSLLAALKKFFSGTAISRLTGVAREVAMATLFGTDPLVAAFWMAFRFAHLMRRLFGEGALHAAFVPHFEALRKEESAAGARFFYDLSMGLSLFLFLTIVIIEAVLGSILLFGSTSEGNTHVIRLTMIMLPSVLFISLYALNTSLLNCERTFFLPSVAPAVLNLIWILAVIILHQNPLEQAIKSLAMILVFAFAIQWGVTLPKVIRFLSNEIGEKWRKRKFSSSQIMKILRPFALGMLGVAATQINSALDVIFARIADAEGPAYLWYALRIQQLPLALFGVGMSGALLPPITRAIQRGDEGGACRFLNFAIDKSVSLLIPVTGALFLFGFAGINLLYGHGAFSDEAIITTTYCLWGYGGALLPMTLVLILATPFYARKDYLIPTLAALFAVCLNVILNTFFVFALHLGAVSIALATSISACANAALLAVYLKKRGLKLKGIPLNTFKISLATLFALATTLFALPSNTLAWIKGAKLMFHRELLAQLISFGSQAALFAIALLIAAYLLRIPEVVSLVEKKKAPADL